MLHFKELVEWVQIYFLISYIFRYVKVILSFLNGTEYYFFIIVDP